MRNSELEGPQDDLDIEITDLDKVDADRPVAARLPEKPVLLLRRHRGLVTVATTGLVVLALLLILLSIAPIRQLFTPAVQQTTFYYRLDANPLWGHLFVDGRAVRMNATVVYPLFSLTRGKRTLLWRADPFAPQQCVVMVPVGSGIDNCKHPEIPPASGGTDSYISFPVDLSTLSTAQRNALLQTTQAVFDSQQSSEMVRTGERYAQTSYVAGPNQPSCTVLQTAALCLAYAHQPLKATLRLQLDTNESFCSAGACESNGPNCLLFCDPFMYASPNLNVSPTVWQATVYVQLFWRFTALNGRVVADNQADTFIRGQQNDTQVPLNITWNGRRWGVATTIIGDYGFSGDPGCDAATRDLYTLQSTVPAVTSEDTIISMNPIPGTTFASGCLIEFKLQTGVFPAPTPAPPPPLVAFVIQRFGVLLAVNSAAHHLFPFLPVADAYEKQLAQQWAKQQGMSITGVNG
jgi:hypothetical protein